jgi:branched-chain amino acid transport system substrate-binding protein
MKWVIRFTNGRSKQFATSAFILMVLIVLVGFAGGARVEAKEVLKIGVMGTLSGAATRWGEATKRGAELAIDDWNLREKEGLKADGKIYDEMRLIAYDDKYTGTGGTAAAQRLIYEDKVRFILGPIGSPAVIAAGLIANREKVLMLSNGFSDRVLGVDKPYTFRVANTPDEAAPAAIKWLKRKFPNLKTYAMMHAQDEVGQAVAPKVAKYYKEAGFQLVADERFERDATDFVPLLTRILRKNPDFIEPSPPPMTTALIIKQVRQLGYRGPLVMMGLGSSIYEVLNVAAEQAEGLISWDSYDRFDPDPKIQSFVKKYKAKYGTDDIDNFCPIFYVATTMLLDLIKKEGTLDAEKTDGYQTLLGPIRWTGLEMPYKIRHQIVLPFYIKKIENGKIVMIEKVIP